MEKFSDFRDKGTGISPFMPAPNPDLDKPLLKFLIKPIVFTIKLPFALVFIPLLAITSIIPPLYRSLLMLYLTLFFNLNHIELLVDGVKKSNLKVIDSKKPRNNEIVFINFASPFDSLVLTLISKSSSNVFLYVSDDGSVEEIGSALDCFKFALSGPAKPTTITTQTANLNLKNYKNKTLFLITEGTTSNNKSVLKFPKKFNLESFIAENKSQFKFKALSVKSYPTYLTTTPIPQSFLSFVYQNVSTLKFNVNYKLKIFDDLDGNYTEDNVREKLSNFGKLKLISEDFDYDKKNRFTNRYRSVRK